MLFFFFCSSVILMVEVFFIFVCVYYCYCLQSFWIIDGDIGSRCCLLSLCLCSCWAKKKHTLFFHFKEKRKRKSIDSIGRSFQFPYWKFSFQQKKKIDENVWQCQKITMNAKEKKVTPNIVETTFSMRIAIIIRLLNIK